MNRQDQQNSSQLSSTKKSNVVSIYPPWQLESMNSYTNNNPNCYSNLQKGETGMRGEDIKDKRRKRKVER